MENLDTLVFSSGGIRFIAFVGAMKALNKKNMLKNIKTYVGVSAGAIFAYFLNIGYSWQELYKITMEFNFSQLNQFNIEIFFERYGLNDGEKLTDFIKMVTIRKQLNENITFLELYNFTHKKLIISATCISNSQLEYFDYIRTPNMKILTAIRLSMSVPYYFTTEEYSGKLYIDGAILEHLPVSLFEPSDKILGLSLVDNCVRKPITSLEEFTYSIFYCMRNNIEKKRINDKNFNIVEINTKNHNLLNFDICKDDKKDLFLCGYNDTITQITCFISKKEYELKHIDKIQIENNIKNIEKQIKNLIKEKNKLRIQLQHIEQGT